MDSYRIKPRPLLVRVLGALAGRIIALILLVATLPLMLVIAFAIVISERSTPFFHQIRIGEKGRSIQMLKFRTMRIDANPYMPKPNDTDPLITPIGRHIRGRAMDELPQLWNVLRGKMALVGPRPEMGFVVDSYGDIERLRLQAKPGLTGLWQLSRVRDRAIHHHIEYDLFYVFNRSLAMDVWLLWRTFLFALTGRPTQIRLAVQRWERNVQWRKYVPERSVAIPRREGPLLSRVWLATGVASFLIFLAPAIVMAALAKDDLTAARTKMLLARAAMQRIEQQAANSALTAADNSLSKADKRLTSWITVGGRLVPGVKENIRTARSLALSGRELVAAAREGVKILESVPVQDGHLTAPWREGTLNLQPFILAAEPALRMGAHVREAERLVSSEKSRLLIPQIREARKALTEVIDQAKHQSDAAAGAAILIPMLLGADGPRNWVLGAENNAELRGRGGYLGSFGMLSADKGRLSLGGFRPVEELPSLPPNLATDPSVPSKYKEQYGDLGGLAAWQNLLMSPHFPSGAELFLSQLRKTAGIQADGLISVDPIALSYILEVTGPVEVPGFPETVNSKNLVDWSLNRIYFLYQNDNQERRLRLAQLAEVIWDKLLSAKELDPRKLGDVLGRAVSERHIVIYSSVPSEQLLLERLRIAGSVRDTANDYLMLVAQNVGENKMDYYLDRSIDYRGRLRGDGSMDVRLEVTVRNTAPQGLVFPSYVGGSRTRIGLSEGRARDFFTVFVPQRARLQEVSVDGKPTPRFDNDLERGKRRLASYIEVGPGESRTLLFNYTVPHALAGRLYRLSIQSQATVRPDDLSVDIELPSNSSVSSRMGFLYGKNLSWSGPLSKDMELSAEVRIPISQRLIAKITTLLSGGGDPT